METKNVVAAIIRKGDKIFATQRGYGEFKDWWEFPGGKIEAGETAEEALEREVKEELIGEIGSSMMLAACGLRRQETHQQIDAVCKKWIDAMNKDYRLIVTASYAAEKAAKYVLGEFAE